jgi:hypothetical protein
VKVALTGYGGGGASSLFTQPRYQRGVLPARIGNVRVDFINGLNAADGLTYSVRTCNQDSSLKVTGGWDDVTGIGFRTPGGSPACPGTRAPGGPEDSGSMGVPTSGRRAHRHPLGYWVRPG